jgi:hypothetical protein
MSRCACAGSNAHPNIYMYIYIHILASALKAFRSPQTHVELLHLMSFSAPCLLPAACRTRARASAAAAVLLHSSQLRWLLNAAFAATMMNATFRAAFAQGTWSTAQLSVARFGLAAASSGNFAIFAGGTTPNSASQMSAAVDLYNSATAQWSTAQLSAARAYAAATSVGDVAIFAGGLYAGDVSPALLARDLRSHERNRRGWNRRCRHLQQRNRRMVYRAAQSEALLLCSYFCFQIRHLRWRSRQKRRHVHEHSSQRGCFSFAFAHDVS